MSLRKKRPWFKFYPSDWLSDPNLRVCSLSSRSVWFDCICIMHQAEPYGFLLINGMKPDNSQLARLLNATQDEISSCLSELESTGVFSKNSSGIIYSRRMVRDYERSETGRKNGMKGGNPNIVDSGNFEMGDNLGLNLDEIVRDNLMVNPEGYPLNRANNHQPNPNDARGVNPLDNANGYPDSKGCGLRPNEPPEHKVNKEANYSHSKGEGVNPLDNQGVKSGVKLRGYMLETRKEEPNGSSGAEPFLKDAEIIIQIFDEVLVSVFGEAHARVSPKTKDYAYAEYFLECGAGTELCRQIFTERQKIAKAEGKFPIESLAYFRKALPKAISEQQAVKAISTNIGEENELISKTTNTTHDNFSAGAIKALNKRK